MRANSALLVEADAIREALQYCSRQGFDQVEVETDSLQLVQMLLGQRGIDVEVEGVLFYIQILVRSLRREKL